MNRRSLLAALGALGASGCLGASGVPPTTSKGPRNATPTGTPRPATGDDGAATRVPPSARPRVVSLTGIETADLRERFGVDAGAAVPEGRITGDTTATVRLHLRNRGDRRRRLTYRAEACDANYLFGARDSGPERLVLVPRDHLEANTDGCPRAGSDTAVVTCGIPVTTRTVDLPPGGAVVWRFAVLQTHAGRCLPPGRYAFGRTFGSRRTGDDGAGSTIEGATATLSFGLNLALA